MTLGNTQPVVAAVEQNLRIGFVTKYAVDRHSTNVTAVHIEGFSLERELHLI